MKKGQQEITRGNGGQWMKRTGSILVASCLLPTWVPDCYWFAEEYLKAALLMYCYHIVLILRITPLLPIADHKKLVHTLEDSCHPCRIRETGHTNMKRCTSRSMKRYEKHELIIFLSYSYHLIISYLSFSLSFSSQWCQALCPTERADVVTWGEIDSARSLEISDTAELYLEYVGICWNWTPSYKAELITSHVSNCFFLEWSRSWFLAGAATNLW